MPVNQPKDIPVDEESQSGSTRVIRLEPTWSTIAGLTPPLTEEALQTLKKEKVVQDAFIQPQWVATLKDAQDRFLPKTQSGIGIRAIMVSTDGTTHLTVGDNGNYDVPDINTVLERGTELPEGNILVSSQTERDEDIYALSHSRVLQYLVSGISNILNAKEPEARQKLTPAVLIYDLAQLEQVSGYVHVLKNPTEANKAILGIYPLNIEPAKQIT